MTFTLKLEFIKLFTKDISKVCICKFELLTNNYFLNCFHVQRSIENKKSKNKKKQSKITNFKLFSCTSNE